jgi:hypothetical protein
MSRLDFEGFRKGRDGLSTILERSEGREGMDGGGREG